MGLSYAKTVFGVSLCMTTLILVATFTNTFAQSKLAIVNTSVLDVRSNGFRPQQTVVIENGKIVAMGPSHAVTVPQDATVIKADGKFLIPGLWDMHVHLSYYGDEALEMLVRNGVLAVRDMGGDLKQIDQWRKEISEGTRVGPRIFRAGPFVDGPKKMNAQRSSFTKVVETPLQGIEAVRELKALGVDFIKIHSRVPKQAFFAISHEARKLGLPLMVHAPKELTMSEISGSLARSIEHTESLLGSAIYEEDDVRDSLTDLAFKNLRNSSIFAEIKKNGNYYDPTVVSLYLLKGTEYEKKLGPRLLPLVSRLHREGVPLLTGSDFATKEAGIVPGQDLHGELELFVEAGLSPAEALRAATLNAAECMRVEKEMGTVEVNRLAYLVLLNANPLDDIRNTRKVWKVIVGGKVVEGVK